MSESVSLHPVTAPHTVYLKDYTVPPYLIDEIELNVDLHDDATLVKSRMRVRHNRASADQSNTLVLNGEELELLSVAINGEKLDTSQYELTAHLLILHRVPDNFILEISNRIYPQKNTALSGLYRSAKTYCTQCEAEGFRRITFFMDRPDVLTRYTTTITADAARYPMILSNGNLLKSGKLKDGRHWAKWEDPFRKPSYLFALVAGDFDVLEDKFVTQSGRDVTLRIFVEKGYGEQAHHAMHCVKEAMRWDEKAYGREYDLDIYMIVAIADFNMGAMENKGLNIFNTKYILAQPNTATDDDYIHILSVIGHEYFHNWSGNRVTCRDWFQLSLKEGLTILRDQSFTEDLLSDAVMRIRDVTYLREIQFPEDAGPLAHPVRPESYIEINNFYTATVYNKGAEVLRMMRTILGPALFRKGMDSYFALYDGQAVTIEDYVKIMEDVSGIDLKQFRLWYSQSGTPTLVAEDHYDAKEKKYTLTIKQFCLPTAAEPHKLPLHIPIKMGLLNKQGEAMSLGGGVTEKVLQLTEAEQTFQFSDIPERPLPSLLRHFSAPVKLQFPYTNADLLFLAKYDQDAFNRWEAGQTYALRTLLTLVKDYREDKKMQLPHELTEIYEHLLRQDTKDLFLLAEMLHLPSEKYIGEQMQVIDVDAIHAARESMLHELAAKLHSTFLEVYRRLHEEGASYQFNMQAIGKRQLKNLCLSYLLLLPQYTKLGLQQVETSLKLNMTDTLAAMTGLANLNVSERQTALDMFYQAWQHDALVMDKWFAMQAGTKLPTALPEVKKLMRHPAFDIKNPNKVYALIGAFGRNLVNLHASNGAGYVFLRETVELLDGFNPQVAARMVKPLTTWKRYDKERQVLMRNQLELLLQNKNLSRDVYELATKSIE